MKLTDEQMRERLRASELRQRAAEIGMMLGSGTRIGPKQRETMKRERVALRAEVERIMATLPRIDPWGNVIEGKRA